MRKYFLGLGIGLIISNVAFSWEWIDTDVKSHFPIEHYFNRISDLISPASQDYELQLPRSKVWQAEQMKNFYRHYFGDESPWSSIFINSIYHDPMPDNPQTKDLKSLELKLLHDKNNMIFSYDAKNDRYVAQRAKTGNEIGYDGFYGSAKPYTNDWIKSIEDNIDLSQFDRNQNYNPINRAIAIDNLNARVLPTDDIYSLNYRLPGEGEPFDYLQMSVIWAGTPVYILQESKDKIWYLVASPDVIAWVHSSGIVRVDESFVIEWEGNAYKNGLVAIAKTKTPIVDETNKQLSEGYIGAVFPLAYSLSDRFSILAPPLREDPQPVKPRHAVLSKEQAVLMPLSPTPHNFVNIMEQLINRPYGWGNYKFYNDCSGEMKNFYAAFGIWLPRNSLYQVNTDAAHPSNYSLGTIHDFTLLTTAKERINNLLVYGHKYTSLIYIGGHILMYIGSYPDPQDSKKTIVLTYQNLWGLRPTEAAIKAGDHERRAVIGKSVLFPLLLQYPEDFNLGSLAAKSYFKMINLDEVGQSNQLLQFNMWLSNRSVNLAALMLPSGEE